LGGALPMSEYADEVWVAVDVADGYRFRGVRP
jgi:hypothetical protein